MVGLGYSVDVGRSWAKKNPHKNFLARVIVAPRAIRTPDPFLRREVLYPAELSERMRSDNNGK